MSERFRKIIDHDIQSAGLSCVGVMAGLENPHDPSYTHTIGLSPKWGFELLVVALHPHWAMEGFNKLYVDAKHDGILPKDGQRDYRLFRQPIMYRRARPDKVRDYVRRADFYYDRRVDVLQVVMCDRMGRFEGEPGYDAAFLSRQPKLYA